MMNDCAMYEEWLPNSLSSASIQFGTGLKGQFKFLSLAAGDVCSMSLALVMVDIVHF